IVKQRGQHKPCFLALRFREIIVKKGVREQARALRPFHRRSTLCPIQEFLSHHGFRIQNHIAKSVSVNMVNRGLPPPAPAPPSDSAIMGVPNERSLATRASQ